MIKIDMTEEPENENDLIFKAQNIIVDDEIIYVIPFNNDSKFQYYDTDCITEY